MLEDLPLKKLYNAFKYKITNTESIQFLTDGENAYSDFVNKIDGKLFIVEVIQRKPRIFNDNLNYNMKANWKTKYYIQNVNIYHSKLENWGNIYKNVSSKNLVKYINWVKWVRANKNNHYSMVTTPNKF
ncbi:hypothetical protein ACXYRQ_02405 [Mycoplasma sp. 394]